jgi:N6-L-threonylcarbamoyladenine synthase
MKVLSVQSAVAQGSVALYDDKAGYECLVDIPLTGKLSTALAPAMNEILKEADWDYPDIELYACAAGPGSFTGLRVGMALGKGLALSVGCLIKAVSTLDIIRYSHNAVSGPVLVAIDARSERVYYTEFGKFIDNVYLMTSEPRLASVEELLEVAEGANLVIGPDIGFLKSLIPSSDIQIAEVYPDALTLAKIACARFRVYGGDDPVDLAPIYLKSGQV